MNSMSLFPSISELVGGGVAAGFAIERESLLGTIKELSEDLHEVREDMLKISDAFDNAGWAPLNQKESSEISLSTVKKMAKLCRAMTMNPFVKRGVNARISYIWGKGVTFDNADSVQNQIDDNQRKMFSPQGYEELERVLATDGNAFFALPVDTATEDGVGNLVYRIPLNQIAGTISNPDDIEEIWYYKREWSVIKTSITTGKEETKEYVKYYPSIDYMKRIEKRGKSLPRRMYNAGVEQEYAIQHIAVNRQVGWRWGVPDVAPVVFWAKAYKEYLEDNASLVKAYSRLAWQVKAPTVGGAQSAAAQVMAPPSRDPFSGEERRIGGTGVTGPGMEITPTSVNGSQVDFSKGQPLASAIAAGLEVSLVVITSDPGSGSRSTAETLDLPTLKAMESRQELHKFALKERFAFWGNDEVLITFPQIETDATKDRIAAIGTALELHSLYPEEGRKEILDTLGIAPFKPWDEMPSPEDDVWVQHEAQQAEIAAEREAQAAERSVVAKQGVNGGTSAKGGAQSTANQARDNRAKDSKNR